MNQHITLHDIAQLLDDIQSLKEICVGVANDIAGSKKKPDGVSEVGSVLTRNILTTFNSAKLSLFSTFLLGWSQLFFLRTRLNVVFGGDGGYGSIPLMSPHKDNVTTLLQLLQDMVKKDNTVHANSVYGIRTAFIALSFEQFCDLLRLRNSKGKLVDLRLGLKPDVKMMVLGALNEITGCLADHFQSTAKAPIVDLKINGDHKLAQELDMGHLVTIPHALFKLLSPKTSDDIGCPARFSGFTTPVKRIPTSPRGHDHIDPHSTHISQTVNFKVVVLEYDELGDFFP